MPIALSTLQPEQDEASRDEERTFMQVNFDDSINAGFLYNLT